MSQVVFLSVYIRRVPTFLGYPLSPMSYPGRGVGGGGSGHFPNYLNGYVPPNRVVVLECFRLLRNSVCRVGSQQEKFSLGLNMSSIAGRLGKTLK